VPITDVLGGQPLPLTEACARLGVPLRSLNADINEAVRMSAGLYWHRPRLHAACNPRLEGRAHSVIKAAALNGFREPGRFAEDYQEFVGQLTTQTMQRSPAVWFQGRVQSAHIRMATRRWRQSVWPRLPALAQRFSIAPHSQEKPCPSP